MKKVRLREFKKKRVDSTTNVVKKMKKKKGDVGNV